MCIKAACVAPPKEGPYLLGLACLARSMLIHRAVLAISLSSSLRPASSPSAATFALSYNGGGGLAASNSFVDIVQRGRYTNKSNVRRMTSMDNGESKPAAILTKKHIVVDPFCYRQFTEKSNSNNSSDGYAGVIFTNPISEFETIINSRYNPSLLIDGYAPFCKHLFLINDFTTARTSVIPITESNMQCLRSRYEARTELELPVLTRHFDRKALVLQKQQEMGNGGEAISDADIFPVAKYLDLILYSREQIMKENIAMGKAVVAAGEEETAPWGIVSIKAQDVKYELPMTPITILRNALGKEQGGSGVVLNREAYMESVNYWKDHATVL